MHRSVQIILVALFFFVQAAQAADRLLLEKEATAFSQELTATKNKQKQAQTLISAANILSGLEDCKTALKIRKQAFKQGYQASFSTWMALAKDAYCAGNWKQASSASWTASTLATTPRDKAVALALVAQSLEKRHNWSQDWRPVALDTYQEVLDVIPAKWIKKRVKQLQATIAADKALRVNRIYAQSDSMAPGFCIEFSGEMPSVDDFHYQDYIQTTPGFTPVFSREYGSEICVTGANYGTQYKVMVRKGLTASEKTLPKDTPLVVDIPHRKPSFWFKRSAYVLPVTSKPQVPLYSINTGKISLKLLRIHERNILSPWVQEKFQQELYSEDLKTIANTIGEEIWTGKSTLNNVADTTSHTALNLPKKQLGKPGLYVLVADTSTPDRDYIEQISTQWLVVTDIGLTSYQGSNGLLVMARSLSSAEPLAGVDMVLYARNNLPLAQTRTNSQGLAQFAPGLLKGKAGRTAMQITAVQTGKGLSLLPLQRPAIDLSDRGVSGRRAPGTIDAFVYTEQGVYRPGDTVNTVALLRDHRGLAINSLPLTARLSNPQGNPVLEKVVRADGSGAYILSVPMSASARTGSWKLQWFTNTDLPAIGEASFLVDAIRPPRMEASLSIDGTLQPGKPLPAGLQADYLFGAPAVNRPVSAQLWLDADKQPFTDYADYSFLPAKPVRNPARISLEETTTDNQGKASITLKLRQKDLPKLRYPLRAKVRAEVMDVDGSVITASSSLPLRHLPFYIGISPRFSDHKAAENSQAGFNIVVLDNNGKPLKNSDLQWRLLEIQHDYQWFRKNGEWGYESITRENIQDQGKLKYNGSQPANIEVGVSYGEYRLEVYARKQGLLSSVQFQAGEQLSSQSDTPDAVTLTLEKPSFRIGEELNIQIDSPFQGKATLVLATDRIHAIQNFTLKDGKASLKLHADKSWGGGAYALVSVYQPGKDNASHIARAIGVVWIDIDPVEKTLTVNIETPKEVRSRQTVDIPVKINGVKAGESIHLTLAAVDDGVLQLTGFKTPDPLQYFFGRRYLETRLRDLYGQIIRNPDSKNGQQRSGAGTSGSRGVPPSNITVVSRFSGIVKADDQGVANISLPLPDFNGRLRLMSVAWSKNRLGAAESTLLVRDPLVVSPALPRFITVNDKSSISILLQNLSAAEGRYQITLNADSGLQLPGAQATSIELKKGQSASVSFPVTAQHPGNGILQLEINGPNGYHYSKNLNLGIRGMALPVVRRNYSTLKPSGKLQLDQKQLADLYPDSARLHVQLSSSPGLDVAGLLKDLDRYPYGCLEQLTSRASPLLVFNDLAKSWGLADDPELPQRIQQSIQLILDKQQPEGGFGLWSDQDQTASWASLYALEFLLKARDAGYEVPEYFIDRSLSWVENDLLRYNAEHPEDLAEHAYAHWVLALAGKGRVEEMRYLFDTGLQKLPTPLAAAQLGAALAAQGQTSQAKKAFALALRKTNRELSWQDYGSRLRDLAAIAYLLTEAGAEYGDPAPLITELVQQQQKRQWLSTQEQAWMVLAARTLKPGSPIRLRIDGVAPPANSNRRDLHLTSQQLAAPHLVENLGHQPLWVTTTVEGTPQKTPTTADNQFHIRREVYTLDGTQADLSELKPGEMLVVVIQGQVQDQDSHPALVVDLLPAGLEAENPRLSNGFHSADFDWMPSLSTPRYVDLLDDRYVAAVDIMKGKKPRHFTLAYMARVRTTGNYLWPGTEVEDMYRPFYRARGETDSLIVKP
jgi:uncharacterized protein YfaS (alpha-2-macroglobulin family)